MEINEYVRTKDYEHIRSLIAKVIDIKGDYIYLDIDKNTNVVWTFDSITKHSKDIIDLIEKKDTLLIYDKEYDDTYKSDVVEDNDKNLCVIDYEYNKIIDLKLELYLGNIEIRGILTHEQFESNAYTIEKERCNCGIIYKTK